MHYEYRFNCKDCGNQIVVNGMVYCVPIRDGRTPLVVDVAERTVDCTEYVAGQIGLEGFDD